MPSLTTIERLVSVGEAAVRAAKAAKALRANGNAEAAMALEAECTRTCKAIVQTAARRRAAAAKARAARR